MASLDTKSGQFEQYQAARHRRSSGGNSLVAVHSRHKQQPLASHVMHGWFQTEDCLAFMSETRFLDHTFNCVRGSLERHNSNFAMLINPILVQPSAMMLHREIVPVEALLMQQEAQFRWRVMVTGKVGCGKSALVHALCRLNIPDLHCETLGAAVYKTHWPVMLNLGDHHLDKRRGRPNAADFSQIRWVAFEFCDVGTRSEATFSYLKSTNDAPSVGGVSHADGHDARILVFAMDDRKSFESIKNLLQTNAIRTVPTIVVGTHFDCVSSYSITEEEISVCARVHSVPIVLVNSFAHFSDSEGVSNVVEVLTEALLSFDLGDNATDFASSIPPQLKQSI